MQLESFLPMERIGFEYKIRKILETNSETEQYGLKLSEKEARELVMINNDALKAYGRVEIGESVVKKLALKFSESSYIAPDKFAEILGELTEIFYEAKEEGCDNLADDVIINIMFSFFETKSGGSIDLLRERDMDELCRYIRNHLG